MIDTPISRCYDSVMFSNKLEMLEGLVSNLVGELRSLRAENKRLNERVNKLDKDNLTAVTEKKKFLVEREKTVFLERKTRKIEEEKSRIRSRVKTILKDLERMDMG